MNSIYKIVFLCFALIYFCSAIAQTESSQLISLSRNITINEALNAIEKITVAAEGKKIYNTSSKNPALGIPIKNTNWKDALKIICSIHNLELTENAGTLMITDPQNEATSKEINLEQRQVKISAQVLEIKKTVADKIGIDWSSIINGAVEFSGEIAFNGAQSVGADDFFLSGSSSVDSGDQSINVDILMSILEENQDGEVLAKPAIFVDSGKKGFIQVGKDFSIKTVDEAGNTTDQFFSTGVILDVTPTIISDQEGNEAVNLLISVERSSAIPGEVSTEITKSKANSSITLYNGEETTIGGLYDKDETNSRGGVPLLKDLPWWVFGLRYVFGYETRSVTEKELVIIIKAEIVDPVLMRRDSKK